MIKIISEKKNKKPDDEICEAVDIINQMQHFEGFMMICLRYQYNHFSYHFASTDDIELSELDAVRSAFATIE